MNPHTNGFRMKPSILVTGGAGYIGSHTVCSLLEDRTFDIYDIVVVDNLVNAYMDSGAKKPESLRRIEDITGKYLQFYQVDIRDETEMDKVFKKHDIYSVIHFAALKAVGESVEKPLEYYRTNITGTCILLELMRKNNVYNLIYSSSSTVYGDPDKLPIDETQPTGRGITCPYGRTKYFCEQIMNDVCISDQKWKIVSLRYFNPVGAHRSGQIGEDPSGIPNNLMPYIAQVAVGRREKLNVFGNDYPTIDGTGVRDYIHVVDLAEGHIKAIQLFQGQNRGFEAINLGTGTGYSVLQMITAFETASGRQVPYKITARRAGDIATNYADVTKAKTRLQWTAKRGLDDMCQDTWKWQSSNPNGYHG